jgi:hypothetical protein
MFLLNDDVLGIYEWLDAVTCFRAGHASFALFLHTCSHVTGQRTEAGRLSLIHLSLRESYGLLRVSPSTIYASLYNATHSLRTTPEQSFAEFDQLQHARTTVHRCFVSTRWLCSIRGTRRGSPDREDSLNPEHPPSHLLSRTMGRRSCDLVVRHDRHLYPNPLTDSSRASSGFKINVANLESLSLSLGVNTTAPAAAVGVSVNYGPFFTVNVSEGMNPISLTGMNVHGPSVVRINVENWQNNRLNLESISVNRVCCSSSHN